MTVVFPFASSTCYDSLPLDARRGVNLCREGWSSHDLASNTLQFYML